MAEQRSEFSSFDRDTARAYFLYDDETGHVRALGVDAVTADRPYYAALTTEGDAPTVLFSVVAQPGEDKTVPVSGLRVERDEAGHLNRDFGARAGTYAGNELDE